MRGRKPKPVKLKRKDVTELKCLLRDGHTPQRVAQRARILLARADGAGVAAVAAKVDQDPATIWRVCECYRRHGLQAALQDAPRRVGWELTHWSTRSLALAAVEQDLVPQIHPATVGRLLHAADLQPHLWRSSKTTVCDEEAVMRATKILWYYERIKSLWQRGEVVLALDEKPTLQVLEPIAPGQLMRPGQMNAGSLNIAATGPSTCWRV